MDRRAPSVLTASLILAIALLAQPGNAIKCYECNSHNDSRCALEKPPDQLKKDCTAHQNEKNHYVLCRKIVQTVEYEVNGLKPDTRVIRSCGWETSSYNNTCYQRSGFGGRQEVCSCSTDLCNSATVGVSSVALMAMVILKMFV